MQYTYVEGTVADCLRELFVRTIKRQMTGQQQIQEDTSAPHVRCTTVGPMQQDLGGREMN